MNILDNIKSTVTIISIVVAMGVSIWGTKWKQEATRFENNLYKKEVQWKDERGRLVTEVTELRYSKDELKRIAKSDSSKLSISEKQLYIAAKEIEDLNIKLKHVETYNKLILEVKNDSLKSTITKDSTGQILALKPIKTKFLELTFSINKDTVLVNHKYKTDIVSILNRKPDTLTHSGNKRFFIATWINPRYTYWSTTVCDDPKAEITSSVYINFGKYNK